MPTTLEKRKAQKDVLCDFSMPYQHLFSVVTSCQDLYLHGHVSFCIAYLRYSPNAGIRFSIQKPASVVFPSPGSTSILQRSGYYARRPSLHGIIGS
ncbi:uncharacterized protein BT62DRAFT_613762 [Guyanagaster necrorhizus]|uniref:Uncharacterized protein n=1 Tax=Guyanagaster necrorhizus TaxID=856835 RepID=A0A9P7W0U1_9AGAR|nr:uncharacterized protein BT62DRAFT_613762 [Guyanagaster necrorhizus MCA 3950]KAG7449894.1 hypothetical protein BT62DRAFT_613762 [Guyanagaster necrorhizus MCA 3950]